VKSFVESFASAPAVRGTLARLVPGASVQVGGAWGSAGALFVAALARGGEGILLVLVSDGEEADAFAADLETFGVSPLPFPARESAGAHLDAEAMRLRLAALDALAPGRGEAGARVVVAPLLALLQPVPDAAELRRSLLPLATGEPLDAGATMRRLVEAGFERLPLVGAPGEASLRGDILDLFPFASAAPVRIELLEDCIESIRTFDPETQRSVEVHERLAISLARDPSADGSGSFLPAGIPRPLTLVRVEPLRLRDREEALRFQDAAAADRFERLARSLEGAAVLSLQALPTSELDLDARPVQGLAVGFRSAGSSLREAVAREGRVVLLCANDAERRRFLDLLRDQGMDGEAPGESVSVEVGTLTAGFRLPSQRIAFVSHRELVGAPAIRRPRKLARALRTRAIESFFELKEGDLVVHAIHGVARFRGVQRVKRDPGEEDCLVLEFDGGTLLYLPSSRIDLVARYVGAGGPSPALDRLGGTGFSRRKEAVRKALVDLATELLEVQGLREVAEGIRYPIDDALQRDFEASFPYPDTEDQAAAGREIKGDMEALRPMDRLLCGDVGYGKTELAVRAAFKVVNAGKQVAVLVPTTVLAQQHYETFRERLADYPVEVDVLSRFRSDPEIAQVLAKAEAGAVDILIGTHRLLSQDVKFKDLGLVVIDEEQRFGVRHKERLKRLRATVDVLTLSATPIPRTLHMSLLGLRDISVLATAPVGRQDIETRVLYDDEPLPVREGILREINRGGQVFFLHNRVQSIDRFAADLGKLVPQARIAVGHGQMPEDELEDVMVRFVKGEVDVLVSTTIVESGLDIPRANTIFIDQAQRFGLSDLHQLRGRVGRWKHKAHCYLILPRHEPLIPAARARMKAITELHHLGAGFSIAMRDLEIRGSGNLLGSEQSGHIGAVGYDLYCRLLRVTVARLRGEPADDLEPGEEAVDLEAGVRAYVPDSYISEPRLRLEVLHEFDGIVDEPSRAQVEASLRDRFGPPPPEGSALLDLFLLKRLLRRIRVRSVHWQPDRYLIVYDDRARLEGALRSSFPDLRYIKPGLCHAMLPGRHTSPEAALARLKEALLRVGERPARKSAPGPARARRG
jgi:transcription-repair coupling factor (superfamily II helicase)